MVAKSRTSWYMVHPLIIPLYIYNVSLCYLPVTVANWCRISSTVSFTFINHCSPKILQLNPHRIGYPHRTPSACGASEARSGTTVDPLQCSLNKSPTVLPGIMGILWNCLNYQIRLIIHWIIHWNKAYLIIHWIIIILFWALFQWIMIYPDKSGL